MKVIQSLSEYVTTWVMFYTTDPNLKDENLLHITFENRDEAIGAAKAVLLTMRDTVYACVHELSYYMTDEFCENSDIDNVCIWEAWASEDGIYETQGYH